MRALLFFSLLTFTHVADANSAAIHDAAKKGDLAALTSAIDAGADVNKASLGATPLYYAALSGHVEAVKLLIARGADVNAKARLGTPLMAAAARGSVELVNVFLAGGADADAELQSKTALHVAAERGCLTCVKTLVEAGANVNAQHLSGSGDLVLVRTPLHLAIFFDHGEVSNYLMAHGVIFPKPALITDKLASADVGKGQEVFEKKCYKCHSKNAEQSVTDGPLLWDIVGRDKASSTNYQAYSKTLLAADGAWSYEALNVFLSGPTVTTPGVKMQVQGVPDEADRVNVIAFLRTLSDKPVPLP